MKNWNEDLRKKNNHERDEKWQTTTKTGNGNFSLQLLLSSSSSSSASYYSKDRPYKQSDYV
jgi:hypothetical protein